MHFCLQYKEWQEEIASLNFYGKASTNEIKSTNTQDPTYDISSRVLELESKMQMIRDAATETDPDIGDCIFIAVTEDRPFSYFEAKGVACGRDMFYDRLRKFFYLLDKRRK